MTGMRRRPEPLGGEPVTPRPAATVVLVRPGPGELEVLLTLRPSTMAFAAGMMVFPGGRVDPADADEPYAAIRELFEEAGILLVEGPGRHSGPLAEARCGLLDGSRTLPEVVAGLGVRLDLRALVPIARWVTPAAYARRFDARFFAAELPAGAEATFVGDEVADHRWTTPSAALEAMANGEIEMWIPTSATLQRLRGCATFRDLRDRMEVPSFEAPAPRVERLRDDRVRISGWTAGGAPGRLVETFIVGRQERTIVNPGDPSPEALAAIVEAATSVGAGSPVQDGSAVGVASSVSDGPRIAAIVVSSADPYVAAGADELSERTGALVFGPPGSSRMLPFPVVEIDDDAVIPDGDPRLSLRELFEGLA